MNRGSLSVDDIVSRLEAQLAFHQEREAFHAGLEAQHREQREAHAAEAEKIRRNLEAFRATAAAAADLALRSASSPRPAAAPAVHRRLSVRRMALAVIGQMGRHEPFGTAKVTEEINRQFGSRLREPVDLRMVSIALRRLARDRSIHRLRPGKPHHEALYARERPPA
jgi:hypothetical protein